MNNWITKFIFPDTSSQSSAMLPETPQIGAYITLEYRDWELDHKRIGTFKVDKIVYDKTSLQVEIHLTH